MSRIFLTVTIFILALTVTVKIRERLNNITAESLDRDRNDAINESNGPMEFLKFHHGIRTRSNEQRPSYPLNYQWKELERAKKFVSLKASSSSFKTSSVSNGVISFTERGPGNVPGRTRGLIVDPDDATHNTWLAGSASGGIWKTVDGGANWSWISKSIPNMATTCLEMANSNHDVIFAGSGEGFGSIDAVNGQGIFKSSDRGVTWNLLLSSEIMGNINRIVVDPLNENNVLAASNSGIFQSSDGGGSWVKVYSGLVQDLRATPSNFSILYATENGVGVLKSIDGGSTWNKSSTAMAPDGRIEIAISPVKTDRIIASAEGPLSGTHSDLYLSDDGGSTWYLVELDLGKPVDYLSNQGWYDNTVVFSPYDKDVVYVGGVSAFKINLGSLLSSSVGSFFITEYNTGSFLSLASVATSATGFPETLGVGSHATHDTIQVRFGPSIHQKAISFGHAGEIYYKTGYVYVPFQVWNVSQNVQLTVSFLDVNNNTEFDLTTDSKESIYINDAVYDSLTPPDALTSFDWSEMFHFLPVLANGATWDPTNLPSSNLQIDFKKLNQYSSSVTIVADAYNTYGGINNADFVHPDHHNIYPIKQNDAAKTFQLLLANDGGVFLSGTSTSPGTKLGEWRKVGNGYNTSQFYGADKRPGAQEYIGGMQDNATYFTPSGSIASASTLYVTDPLLAGDGFEVLWNAPYDITASYITASSQFNNFVRSTDGGKTWVRAVDGLPTLSNGLTDPRRFPFISKLAGSRQDPLSIYTVGTDGVWKQKIGYGSWKLTPISYRWNFGNFTDVEVSRANPSIVWAGSGQFSSANLFVSIDGGDSFNAVPNPEGYTLGNITKIATDPIEPHTAYALYSFSNYAKILKTTDLGQSWKDISGFGTGVSGPIGFPDVAVYCLYVRADNPNIIWAGTEIGIVESIDGGSSWNLLTDFPNVSVWDMKGQDKEIVIATHGRGIWTAELVADQSGTSRVVASGTSPQSKFKVVVNVPFKYDSLSLFVSSTTQYKKVSFIPPDTGTYVLTIPNAPKGKLSMFLISHHGTNQTYPFSSTPGTNFQLAPYNNKYFDSFTGLLTKNFDLNGFSLQFLGYHGDISLQTDHYYDHIRSAYASLLTPIIVSNVTSSFIFDNIALVQPGENGSSFGQASFHDYVIAEATKDGLNWIPISNGYNASANAKWLSAFNSSQAGSPILNVTENFDLRNNFASGDTILVRFRLTPNGDNIVGWGWSIDNLYIQQSPTAIELANDETISIYPIPSSGMFNVKYTIHEKTEVIINVWDMTGRIELIQNLGVREAGDHETTLNLDSAPNGIYLILLKTNSLEKSLKIQVNR